MMLSKNTTLKVKWSQLVQHKVGFCLHNVGEVWPSNIHFQWRGMAVIHFRWRAQGVIHGSKESFFFIIIIQLDNRMLDSLAEGFGDVDVLVILVPHCIAAHIVLASVAILLMCGVRDLIEQVC